MQGAGQAAGSNLGFRAQGHFIMWTGETGNLTPTLWSKVNPFYPWATAAPLLYEHEVFTSSYKAYPTKYHSAVKKLCGKSESWIFFA